MGTRLGRALALGQTHGRPMHLPASYARAVIDTMGSCPGFNATLTATLPRRFLATAPIEAPVTVAFGTRDLVLLPHQSRHLDQLPPGTRLATLPAGGHVPMADNPGAVTALILGSTGEGGGCDSRGLWG